MKFLQRFVRITSTGTYIPEVDGIRFIAIISVLLFHAAVFYMDKQDEHLSGPLNHFFLNGYTGVYIFFALSGYILSVPFCEKFERGESLSPASLRTYFLRRLTRLEPPYIISLLLFFALLVWGTHKYAAASLAPHLIASLGYVHSIVFLEKPVINTPLWTLEIEIQFYLVAPFICFIFFKVVRKSNIRIFLLAAAVVIFSLLSWYFPLPFQSLWDVFSFFLAGILVTQLVQMNARLPTMAAIKHPLSLLLLIVILYNGYDSQGIVYQVTIKFMIVLLFALILRYKALSFLFSNRTLCVIGGACYSIYLVHYPAISLVGRIVRFSFSENAFLDEAAHLSLYVVFALIVGMTFYKIAERPFMDKEWPQKALAFFRR